MQKITYQKLLKMLEELLTCNAFELHKKLTTDGTQTIYIPYMMNDALECFLFLTNARLTGDYLPDFKDEMSVELVETEKLPALIFRQGKENVFTLWFENCYQILSCYRYDQIGHFWVSGVEHWRRLVYIIGTIYDKYEYLGEQVCNAEEVRLLPLMEFAPFRHYSPIHESLDEHYPDTLDGLQTMAELAKEADDRFFLILLRLYRLLPNRFTTNLLAKALNHPGRSKLYELIYTKIQNASMNYPDREYSPELNEKIKNMREEATITLKEHGFSGEYPLFHKENIQVLATEEHPFTILDWEHYAFRIQYMVSKATTSSALNYGFFDKFGNSGRIETELKFLKTDKGWA